MPEVEPPVRTGSDMPARWLTVVAALAATAALVVVFRPAFRGAVFLYGDLGMVHLPVRMFYADNLAHGRPSLWLPNLFCGFYFLGGGGVLGMYHPLHWLLYRLLPVGAAFNVECALSYPLLVVGTCLFLRRLRLPAAAAMFGGIIFGFSGYAMVRLTHVNVMTVVAHLPWLLWATDIALRDGNGLKRDLALVGVAVLRGSQLLLAYPGGVYLSLLCEGLYVAPLAVAQRRVGPMLWLGGANLAGIGVGAVQLLPMIDAFAESLRAETSFDYRAAQSLHPLSLLQPWAPYLFRDRAFQVDAPNPIEQTFYLGAVVPVAATWAAVRRAHLGHMRPIVLGAAGATALGLALALGRYGPVFRVLAEFPAIGHLRVPSRYTLLVFLGAAVVTAIAYADLIRAGGSRDPSAGRQALWTCWVPLAAALIAAGAIALKLLAALERTEMLGPTGGILLGAALSAVAAGLWCAAARGSRAALVGLSLFTVADQAAYGTSLWWSVPPRTVDEYVAAIPKPPVEPPSRLLDTSAVTVSRNARGEVIYHATTPLIVHGTRLVLGYVGLIPRRQLDYQRRSALRVAGAAAGLAGNRYVSIPGALDRFRFVGDVVVSEHPAAAIETIDVASTAIVDVPVDVSPGPRGAIRVDADVPGIIALRTESTMRQLLVVSEGYHRGWRATVDGADAMLVRAYGDFMGTVVAPGVHDVVLRFEPASFRTGRLVSGLAAGVLLMATMGCWRSRRRVAARRRLTRRPTT
jgi:hypothetical protein